jgi:hypothetical protein
MLPRWVPVVVLALSFGLAGGLELHSLLMRSQVAAFDLESREPTAGHPWAFAQSAGPFLLEEGAWLVIWEARGSRRHQYRVEIRPAEGASLWSRQGFAGSTKRRILPAMEVSYAPLGIFEASGEMPFFFDLHVEPVDASELPSVRLYMVPTGKRFVQALASLTVGCAALFFALRRAFGA